ncbi:hypothetical protein SELMODRAFT_437797 [Selaginella moellendorffii]|uniref:MBD domain-containing protein n=2 Tax=Selaginella moellendorffii TaxID=88036 RepID=D8QTR8_SELML|nr:hypothetical protein SELMODRAFT_437797 [Selaginella moellendorffii]
MISSSSRATVVEQQQQQHRKRSSVCSVNTEFQDALIPDLNIAHVPSSSDEDAVPATGTLTTTTTSLPGAGSLEEQEEQDKNLEHQRPAVAVTITEAPAPSWLPEGWISECRTRADGHRDKYYIESYSGRRFRSKVEVFKYLETGLPPARWKRKGKGVNTATTSTALGDPNAPRSLEQHRETLGGLYTSANNNSFSTGADFFVAKTSSSVSASDTFNASHASFDGLRGVAMNGIAPPPPAASFSLHRSGLDMEQHAKKPVVFDYWTSTLGAAGGAAGGSGVVTSLTSSAAPRTSSTSWTENYKVGNTFINGMSSSVPSFVGSKATTSDTPHWLDRILNKPPPAAISQPAYSFGLTGGFVQSPLHYLQNAGAFHNNWLNLKPPTAITQSDYDVPWKSRSWFDRREPDRLERRATINLNQPLVDPDEEARAHYPSEYQADHRHRHDYSSHATSSLENLWKKAVPITLEHREYVAYSNGSRASKSSGSHHQQQQQQHHHHQHQTQSQQQQQPQQQQPPQHHSQKHEGRMLPPSEEDMEVLARDLAALEEEFRDAKSEAESLRALLAAETQCRQAAENLCASLEGDKARLMKSQEEFLAQTVQQLDYKSKFEVLWQEVNLRSEQDNAMQQEHERAVSTLQEKFQTMEAELNARISSLEKQLRSKESCVIQLEQEIAQLHDSMDILNQNHEERRKRDQTEFQREITALKLELQTAKQANHSLSEQLEKQQQNSLLEKTRLEAQIQDLSSNWQVGALKQKLMKLRKENEDLKRRRF